MLYNINTFYVDIIDTNFNWVFNFSQVFWLNLIHEENKPILFLPHTMHSNE